MARTAMIRARTEPALKSEVERILEELGMTSTEAVNLFYRQVKLQKGLPFDVKIPNKTTLETFRKTDEGKEINEYKDMKAFLKKIKKNA
jgi:DNA-damage-inducible protein J